jgi:hypothetical protein
MPVLMFPACKTGERFKPFKLLEWLEPFCFTYIGRSILTRPLKP